jgi:hypothetical protein
LVRTGKLLYNDRHGYTLKRNFIIKGHTVQDYAGLYITYETSDIDNFLKKWRYCPRYVFGNPAGVDPYTYAITAAPAMWKLRC